MYAGIPRDWYAYMACDSVGQVRGKGHVYVGYVVMNAGMLYGVVLLLLGRERPPIAY